MGPHDLWLRCRSEPPRHHWIPWLGAGVRLTAGAIFVGLCLHAVRPQTFCSPFGRSPRVLAKEIDFLGAGDFESPAPRRL